MILQSYKRGLKKSVKMAKNVFPAAGIHSCEFLVLVKMRTVGRKLQVVVVVVVVVGGERGELTFNRGFYHILTDLG